MSAREHERLYKNARRMCNVRAVSACRVKKFGQELTKNLHFEIARDMPGEEKVPSFTAYLSTRTTMSVFKVSSNLGEVMVCAFPVVSVEVYTIAKSKPSERKCKNDLEVLMEGHKEFYSNVQHVGIAGTSRISMHPRSDFLNLQR